MFTIYTKIDGNLANWGTDATIDNYELARTAVRDELGTAHKQPILVLITNEKNTV